MKYAAKVGAGAVLYAMWSFFPSTRAFYSHWRGEWGLLSYMLVCSMVSSSLRQFETLLITIVDDRC